jgi:hypothetical protein
MRGSSMQSVVRMGARRIPGSIRSRKGTDHSKGENYYGQITR